MSPLHSVDALFNAAPCGLLTAGIDDVVVHVNDTFLLWTGYTREDIVGRSFASLVAAGEQTVYATQFQDELWLRKELKEVSLRLVRADGTDLPVLVNAVITADEQGVRLAVFDASNRRDFENEMLAAKRAAEFSESRVRVLQDAAARFLAASSEEELATMLVEIGRSAFGAIDAAVVAYDPEGVKFQVVVGAQHQPMLDAIRASRPAGSKALSPDELFIIRDIEDAYSRSEEVGDLMRAARTSTLTAISIPDGDAILGAFVCLFGTPRDIDQQYMELYRALARHAGLALSRIRLQAELRYAAEYDQLTGLVNRTTIDERAADAFEEAHTTGAPVSLIFLDLDGFKAINDELGHRAGDRVLQDVASRISEVLRREGDTVGRFGGDEFLVVCPGADAAASRAIAERIATAVRAPLDWLPNGFGVTASIGIAVADPGGPTPINAETLTRMADDAMYEAKKSGKDRIAIAA
ncbi:diguanylate cyclase (GGDEF)-like protein/PAS domain S-box-containing protein [Microbacteriaceae bacterium SG_E_30_P1]|uniref:Diguanylate cyclase (GGDEF)-like protein/PAS domain S-box-containing protein n=1 Tax=Antiquaquibacter oligotrophicus TaxID=2880260 RepID=A0ABT6KK94_9MICO|nr:diguanylate cyclase [Antiquaquibacter oligotrophicus]MDH6180131.1 diguanylate cyclase (GGDEF)-like protein/PAS domain S-box-containing protein [Antiquaquibacter oligotrophicus]UDF14118.1 diguanylate cyclase [Antiquaquibacter oligotrophicus]